MDKAYILSEIVRTARENEGKPLGRGRFEKETGIRESDWLGKSWTKWSDALLEAGFQPNEFKTAYDHECLLGKLVALISELDHFPTRAELKMKAYHDPEFPSDSTFENRFGRKRELARKLVEYCEAHGISQRVIDICGQACGPPAQIPDNTTKDDEEFGYVYLIKSGKHFKIGRSNCAERREFELRIQLPERPGLIHKIRTDDPVGIEKYWHDRFAEKRKEGEWFALSATDVKVFKRRKFM